MKRNYYVTYSDGTTVGGMNVRARITCYADVERISAEIYRARCDELSRPPLVLAWQRYR